MMIDDIYHHFNLLPDFPIGIFASRLAQVCRAMIDFEELSTEACDELKKFESLLIKNNDVHVVNFERSEFRGSLESHPFATTLLLIRDGEDKQINHQLELHCAILARLFLERSHDDYEAYLAFYKAFLRNQVRLPFKPSFVILATREELQLELTRVSKIHQNPEIMNVAGFIQPRKVRSYNKNEHPFFTAPIRHRMAMDLNESVKTQLISAVTEYGDEIQDYLQITPQLEQLSAQQFAQFAKKVSGIQRAMYNSELRPPWTNLAATPKEVAFFINSINSKVLKSDFRQLGDNSAGLLFYFLKLLGIAEPGKLILINRGSPKYRDSEFKANSIDYELKKGKLSELKFAHISLNAHLIKIKGPQDDTKPLHFFAQELITMRLAEPMFSLFQNLVGRTDASHRLHHSLEDAFGFNDDDYRTWFSLKHKESGLRSFSITKASLEAAFLCFSKERVPEVTLNFLCQRATTQHHYISQKRETMITQIDTAWRHFMGLIRLSRKSSMQLPSYVRDHDEAGSQLTFRYEVLYALVETVLENIEINSHSKSLAEQIFTFNLLAFFTFLRVATTVGLRPVKEPLPPLDHYSSPLRLMSVTDKRVHHRKECRMIVLTTHLCLLIDAHMKASGLLAAKLTLPQPPSIICAFVEGKWQHFSQAYVERQLKALTGQELDAHSLRHIAATRFLSSQNAKNSITQQAINLLLNHARSSAYALSLWSSESVLSMGTRQREEIETYDAEFKGLDTRALSAFEDLKKGLFK